MSRYAIFDETDGTLVSERYKDELGNDTYLEFVKTFDTEADALRELNAMKNDSCRVIELKPLELKPFVRRQNAWLKQSELLCEQERIHTHGPYGRLHIY